MMGTSIDEMIRRFHEDLAAQKENLKADISKQRGEMAKELQEHKDALEEERKEVLKEIQDMKTEAEREAARIVAEARKSMEQENEKMALWKAAKGKRELEMQKQAGERVSVNARGTIFETLRGTLTAEPESTLAVMLSEEVKGERELFVDCEPEVFKEVLNWLWYKRSGVQKMAEQKFLPKLDPMQREKVILAAHCLHLTQLAKSLNCPIPAKMEKVDHSKAQRKEDFKGDFKEDMKDNAIKDFKLLRMTVERVKELRSQKRTNLRFLDLSGLDLSTIDFEGCLFSFSNLDGCKFRTCNMSKSDFSNTSIISGDFTASSLSNCKFIEANLNFSTLVHLDCKNSVFEKCKMKSVDFFGSDLSKSSITSCDFEGVDFSAAVIGSEARITKSLFTSCLFQNASCVGSIFEECSMKKADFLGADLSRALIKSCDFEEANFDNAKIDNKAVFEGSNLSSSSCKHATFSGSTLKDCLMKKADFSETDFSKSVVMKCSVEDAKFFKVNFDEATLNNLKLDDCNTELCSFLKTKFEDMFLSERFVSSHDKNSLRSAILSDCKVDEEHLKKVLLPIPEFSFSKIDMTGFDLSNLDLTSHTLTECIITRSDLSGSDLSSNSLFSSVLNGCNLAGSVLTGCDFSKCTMDQKTLSSRTDWTRVKLCSVNFEDFNFSKMDLSNSDLSGCGLNGCKLIGTKFWDEKSDCDWLPSFKSGSDVTISGRSIRHKGSGWSCAMGGKALGRAAVHVWRVHVKTSGGLMLGVTTATSLPSDSSSHPSVACIHTSGGYKYGGLSSADASSSGSWSKASAGEVYHVKMDCSSGVLSVLQLSSGATASLSGIPLSSPLYPYFALGGDVQVEVFPLPEPFFGAKGLILS